MTIPGCYYSWCYGHPSSPLGPSLSGPEIWISASGSWSTSRAFTKTKPAATDGTSWNGTSTKKNMIPVFFLVVEHWKHHIFGVFSRIGFWMIQHILRQKNIWRKHQVKYSVLFTPDNIQWRHGRWGEHEGLSGDTSLCQATERRPLQPAQQEVVQRMNLPCCDSWGGKKSFGVQK